MQKTRKQQLKDIVYGAAVGDALGVPFEFKARGSFECTDMVGYGTHNQPAGTWSDDTSMLVATCDSIRACGKIDVDDIRKAFERWFYDAEYTAGGVVFDYGNTTAMALSSRVGCAGEYDNGNGSLMRIAPLALADDADDVAIRAVSAVTHAHKTSTDACVEFVGIVRRVLENTAREHEALSAEYGNVPADDVRSGGYVKDTLRAALWCFATTDNYRDCVLKAVNLGDDTDTTACVAGALAAAAYGIEGIPSQWMETLKGKDVIESCLF